MSGLRVAYLATGMERVVLRHSWTEVVFPAYAIAMPEIDVKSAARLLAVATDAFAPRPRQQ